MRSYLRLLRDLVQVGSEMLIDKLVPDEALRFGSLIYCLDCKHEVSRVVRQTGVWRLDLQRYLEVRGSRSRG